MRSQWLEEGMEGLLGADNVLLPDLGASYGLCCIYDNSLSWQCIIYVFVSVCVLPQQRSILKKNTAYLFPAPNTAYLFPAPKKEGRKCIQDFLPCKGERCDTMCKMHGIFANKSQTVGEPVMRRNQGIPSSATIRGNSTPNPWVPGYPLNCVVFLNNLSERLVRWF